MKYPRAISNNASQTFFQAIRRIRKRNGWSAERLADLMTQQGNPISRNTITAMETGRRGYLTLDEAIAFAVVFKVRVDDILSDYCESCHGTPPCGFSCNKCGRSS